MTDVAAAGASTTTATVVVNTSETQVKKDKKTVRPKATTHPTTAVMVNSAIQCLKERGGSSLQAIKKYISATYKIDGEKFAPFIKKYLKASVTAGTLVQTKGKGASGSFKLAASSAVTRVKPTTIVGGKSKKKKNAVKSTVSTAKGSKVTRTTSTTETKKSAPVKSVKTKKAAAAAVVEKKKPVVVRAAAAAAKSKSPSKVKQTTKAPTKKPKSPKPKTTKRKVAKKVAPSLKKK